MKLAIMNYIMFVLLSMRYCNGNRQFMSLYQAESSPLILLARVISLGINVTLLACIEQR